MAVVALHLEVAVVGCKPTIDNVVDDDAARADCEGTRRFLAAVAGITFDRDVEQIFGRGVPS